MKIFSLMSSLLLVLVSIGAKGESSVRRFQAGTKECVRSKVEELFRDLKGLEFKGTHLRLSNRCAEYVISYDTAGGFTYRAYVTFNGDHSYIQHGEIIPLSDGSSAIADFAFPTTAKVELVSPPYPRKYFGQTIDFSSCFEK